MSTAEGERHPFENPLVRYMIGFSGSLLIIAIAVLFLEGTIFYLALGIAVLDAVATPKILEYAVENDGRDESVVQT